MLLKLKIMKCELIVKKCLHAFTRVTIFLCTVRSDSYSLNNIEK